MLCIFVCFLFWFYFQFPFILAITKDVNTNTYNTQDLLKRFNCAILLSCKRKCKSVPLHTCVCACALSHVHVGPYSEVPRDINHKPCASSCLQRDRFLPSVFSPHHMLHINAYGRVCVRVYVNLWDQFSSFDFCLFYSKMSIWVLLAAVVADGQLGLRCRKSDRYVQRPANLAAQRSHRSWKVNISTGPSRSQPRKYCNACSFVKETSFENEQIPFIHIISCLSTCSLAAAYLQHRVIVSLVFPLDRVHITVASYSFPQPAVTSHTIPRAWDPGMFVLTTVLVLGKVSQKDK